MVGRSGKWSEIWGLKTLETLETPIRDTFELIMSNAIWSLHTLSQMACYSKTLGHTATRTEMFVWKALITYIDCVHLAL